MSNEIDAILNASRHFFVVSTSAMSFKTMLDGVWHENIGTAKANGPTKEPFGIYQITIDFVERVNPKSTLDEAIDLLTNIAEDRDNDLATWQKARDFLVKIGRVK